MVSQPYKAKSLLISIVHPTLGTVALGVVEALNVELIKEGGVEFYYGSATGQHAKGTRHATFTIRRWFMADQDTDLLYDLFNDDTVFHLYEEINGVANSKVYLSACQIYRWRPVSGSANDIVAEEGVGEALDWLGTTV